MDSNDKLSTVRRQATNAFGVFAVSGGMFLLSAFLYLRSPEPGMPLILGLLGLLAGASLLGTLFLRIQAAQILAERRIASR